MGNQNTGLGLEIIEQKQQSNQELLDFTNGFNFQTSQKQQLSFPSYLVMNGQNIQLLSEKDILKNSHKLYRLDLHGFSRLSLTNQGPPSDNRIWKFVDDKNNQQVNAGDSIKLGNIELQLLYIIGSNSEVIQHSDQLRLIDQGSQDKVGAMNQCRLCKQSKDIIGNPLVQLCQCPQAHYKCIKYSLKQQIHEQEYINYWENKVQDIECKTCQQTLPHFFAYKNHFMPLATRDEHHSGYAIWKKIDHDQKNQSHYYQMRLMDGVSISIGRGAESDLVFKNNTVSRAHSLLFYTHKKIFLKDLSSKYGTLHHSQDTSYIFQPEEGISLVLNDFILKIGMYNKPLIELQLNPCCAASKNIYLKIYKSEEDRKKDEVDGPIFDNETIG